MIVLWRWCWMVQTKNSLKDSLLQIYRERGLKVFLEVTSNLLDIADNKNYEKKRRSNGLVCEVVLCVLSNHYIKHKKIKGSIFHSMILQDINKEDSKFRTELDFTLLTPGLCLTGECKSYSGDVRVVGKGTLIRGKSEVDVSKQSVLHAKVLREYLVKCSRLESPPFGIFGFIYSNGRLYDERLLKDKIRLPMLTVSTLFDYYDDVLQRYSKGVYPYEKTKDLFRAFTKSEKLHKEHRDFLGY